MFFRDGTRERRNAVRTNKLAGVQTWLKKITWTRQQRRASQRARTREKSPRAPRKTELNAHRRPIPLLPPKSPRRCPPDKTSVMVDYDRNEEMTSLLFPRKRFKNRKRKPQLHPRHLHPRHPHRCEIWSHRWKTYECKWKKTKTWTC